MQNVRIYEMPSCKMVSSGTGMFGKEKFSRFEEWFSAQKRRIFPKDQGRGLSGCIRLRTA